MSFAPLRDSLYLFKEPQIGPPSKCHFSRVTAHFSWRGSILCSGQSVNVNPLQPGSVLRIVLYIYMNRKIKLYSTYTWRPISSSHLKISISFCFDIERYQERFLISVGSPLRFPRFTISCGELEDLSEFWINETFLNFMVVFKMSEEIIY